MIRAMRLADALLVCANMRELDRVCLRACVGEISDESYACDRFAGGGIAWTLLDAAGVPVAIGGLQADHPGVATWWLVATDSLRKHAKSLLRFGREVIERGLTSGEYHRIQAFVLEDWAQAVRFAECAGMQREGLMRALGTGRENIWVFVKLNEQEKKIFLERQRDLRSATA